MGLLSRLEFCDWNPGILILLFILFGLLYKTYVQNRTFVKLSNSVVERALVKGGNYCMLFPLVKPMDLWCLFELFLNSEFNRVLYMLLCCEASDLYRFFYTYMYWCFYDELGMWKLKSEILTLKDTFQGTLVGGYYCLVVIENVYILVECCIVKQQDSCSFLLWKFGPFEWNV